MGKHTKGPWVPSLPDQRGTEIISTREAEEQRANASAEVESLRADNARLRGVIEGMREWLDTELVLHHDLITYIAYALGITGSGDGF